MKALLVLTLTFTSIFLVGCQATIYEMMLQGPWPDPPPGTDTLMVTIAKYSETVEVSEENDAEITYSVANECPNTTSTICVYAPSNWPDPLPGNDTLYVETSGKFDVQGTDALNFLLVRRVKNEDVAWPTWLTQQYRTAVLWKRN